MSLELELNRVRACLHAGRYDEAWSVFEGQRGAVRSHRGVAAVWLELQLRSGRFEANGDELLRLLERFLLDPELSLLCIHTLLARVELSSVHALAGRLERLRESHAAARIAQRALEQLSEELRADASVAGRLWVALAEAYQAAGPACDEQAENAYQRALALELRESWRRRLARFYLCRGRFDAAVELASVLAAQSGTSADVTRLAVAATGRGDGALALSAWRQLGYQARLGADGLPEVSGLTGVTVGLGVQFRARGGPLRDEERLWVQPISPCHGEVLSPPRGDIGIEAGDLVLWDMESVAGRSQVISKLACGELRTYRFWAAVSAGSQLTELEAALPDDARLYPLEQREHSFCKACLAGLPHDTHASESGLTVVGKLVAWPELEPAELSDQVADTLVQFPDVLLAVPSLFAASGCSERALQHRRLSEALALLF